ncbi:LysE family transporter [Viridibacillus sp. YIM B01967]|uniref:LysE family transporter n=1 Tax=Viridibacillus soli TaxID=2798301 RepID=A0ABS1HCI0_9BACL|nr:LysE family transporter [Viridibacillus soli]MBK3497152.1 LysE family transporter [Viridibacillus soli]
MLALFFANIILGLSIALPVGTITVEMTKQGLKNGFMHGWVVGLGGMTIDIALILLLYFGLASVLSIPMIQTSLWLIGAIFLLYIGYESVKNGGNDISLKGEKPTKSLKSSYFNGLLVAISPGNLVFWISIFGPILVNSFDATNTISFLVIGAGILVGILIHDIGLMTLISGTRKVLNPTYIKWASVLAGLVLIGFSVYFFYEFYNSVI